MAVTRKKPHSRSRAAKRASPSSVISLSIAAVAAALAIIVGSLALHGYAPEPPHLTAEGASGEVAENAEPRAQPDTQVEPGAQPEAQPLAQPETQPELRPKAQTEAKPHPDQGLPQLPEITGFKAATELNPRQGSKEIGAVSYRGSPRPRPQAGARPATGKRTIIFIVDDAGYSMKQLKAILELPFPLTVAVLPGLPHSADAAKAVRAAGKELILHQPMQAVGGQNPGPGAITLGMSDEEVEATIEANLATVPGAVGMNNHMGSAATADLGLMEAAASVAKRRGIYYLDSRTTSESTIAAAARREGIRYWERDVFLDNTPDRASITRAVEDGKKRSEKDRPAIMIGHVWSSELAQALTDLYPQLIAEGFSLSTISRYMVQEATEDDDE